MPTNWTDDPIVPGATRIKAVHINEMRDAIDQIRQDLSRTTYPWTDNPVVAGVTRVRATHFSELRAATQDLWLLKSMGPLPDWSAGSLPSANRTIRASDVNNIRSWINGYESSSNDLDPQGIVSFWYDPDGPFTIDDAWANDARLLKPAGMRLLLRLIAKSRASDNNISDQSTSYKMSLNFWMNRGFTNFAAVLPAEFDRFKSLGPISEYCPNLPLDYDSSGLLNKYINDYSNRARDFVNNMMNVAPTTDLATYWIWNEPNLNELSDPGNNCDSPDGGRGSVCPQVYGALVHTTCSRIRTLSPGATLYMGSINVIRAFDPDGSKLESYFDNMYEYLESKGVDGVAQKYGWDAISLNILGPVDNDYIDLLYSRLVSVKSRHHDGSGLLVGEWGINNADMTLDNALESFHAIQRKFLIMYFYAHNIEFPGVVESFGARQYTHGGSGYILGGELPWYDVLKDSIYPTVP